MWRRWKKKAGIRVLGNPVTPFGPVWLDRLMSRVFWPQGRFHSRLQAHRLFCVPHEHPMNAPALTATMDNGNRLKTDLSQMGVFDTRMPLYQLVRIRSFSEMGFSGFEHRYHSIFENILTDMGGALDLQNLITTLAWHYIISGENNPCRHPRHPPCGKRTPSDFFRQCRKYSHILCQDPYRKSFLKKNRLQGTQNPAQQTLSGLHKGQAHRIPENPCGNNKNGTDGKSLPSSA